LIEKLSGVEQDIFKVWKEYMPNTAFLQGVEECAGKFFVPTGNNIRSLLDKIEVLKKKAENDLQRKLLRCLETAIRFEEPYTPLEDIIWAFFGHLVKEGIHAEHLSSLSLSVSRALQTLKARLGGKDWPVEVKVLTINQCNGLLGILKTILEETKDTGLKEAIRRLEDVTVDYRQTFFIEGVEEGDFEEVFPILEEKGGDIGRRGIYPRILRDMYDYPETPDEIEEKALAWLKEEMPILKEVTEKIAKLFGTEASVESVDEEITKRESIEKSKVVEFILDIREKLRKVVEKRIVRINPRYETKVVETPRYLLNLISTAAMIDFNTLTDHPFNIFFVTTDPKRSPPTSGPDLLQTLVHEEYGHCVNFSNSATRFAAKPTLLELLETYLHYPISDGISFFREYEFMMLLKELVSKASSTEDEEAFLKTLKSLGDLDKFVLESEFVLMKWRIIRFLRAVGDVRINMGKQSIAEFVNWAHEKTGLSKKMIYNQIIIFQTRAGYAPCYSIAGEALRKIQATAIENGRNVVDFNTYASSLGFPTRTIFEEKLEAYARSTE